MSNRNFRKTGLGLLGILQAACLFGCSSGGKDSDAPLAAEVSENPLTSDAASPLDANPDDPAAAAKAGVSLPEWRRRCLIRRGEYLVKHVAACGECHTPFGADGKPDLTKFLAGSPNLFTVAGLGPNGSSVKVSPRNITPDRDTGIGAWTDSQIKRAFLNGIDDQNKALFPIMPYSMFHNMTARDADSIVAYLRSIPAVNQEIPERSFDWPFAAAPIPASAIPNPVLSPWSPRFASAMRGKYLAGNIGLCMDCHTKHVNGPVPLDLTVMFGGGENFNALQFPPNIPTPIISANITTDATGIGSEHWSPADVVRLLKQGQDPEGKHMCPPMPAGPEGAFGGLTTRDAYDIGNYMLNLPPVVNALGPLCHDKLAGGG